MHYKNRQKIEGKIRNFKCELRIKYIVQQQNVASKFAYTCRYVDI